LIPESPAQSDLVSAITSAGWAVTPPVVPGQSIDEVLAALAPVADDQVARGGIRNLLETSPVVRKLAVAPAVRSIAAAVLGSNCFAVRAILFDKTPSANWKVIWHQDLTIAVRARADVPGFGPWSEKEGVVHVQPPAQLLQRMLAVRVHLDDCGAENGPVRVLPGSHVAGRLSSAQVDDWRARCAPVDCLAKRGAILAFRPLILHASSPASIPAHRRVLHLEFAVDALPEPLEWYSRVA
jgi:ectoine hydroxylase-related dioxygenase (phytanoyl-CoA dioxygenase family)